jgi:hypothetical protein
MVLEFNSDDHGRTRKILASWHGGFSSGDSWKLSSGMQGITLESNHWILPQISGSIYHCPVGPEYYGMSGFTSGIYHNIQEKISHMPGVSVHIIPYEQATQ